MKTMYRICMLGLMMCGAVAAEPGPHGPRTWPELKGKHRESGAADAVVDQTVDTCRRRGLSVAQADKLLEPVCVARAEGLPTGCIYEKIDEGLAKQAGVSNVLSAAEARLGYMQQAKVLVSDVVGAPLKGHGRGAVKLIENTGMALESGLDPEVVKAVFRHNGHRQLGRLAHVMEAAETLHLEGFEDKQIQRILIDFVDRHTNRHEMFRAVGVLKDGLASGQDFETIYAQLWVSPR